MHNQRLLHYDGAFPPPLHDKLLAKCAWRSDDMLCFCDCSFLDMVNNVKWY